MNQAVAALDLTGRVTNKMASYFTAGPTPPDVERADSG
jgi:hypothetical protein